MSAECCESFAGTDVRGKTIKATCRNFIVSNELRNKKRKYIRIGLLFAI